MSDLPTGTVTLLLADVEGSTGLWQTQPGRDDLRCGPLDPPWSPRRRPRRGASGRQGEGDSFVIAFTRASDAAACASNYSAPRWHRSGYGSACTPANSASRRRELHRPDHQPCCPASRPGTRGTTVLTTATEELVLDHFRMVRG